MQRVPLLPLLQTTGLCPEVGSQEHSEPQRRQEMEGLTEDGGRPFSPACRQPLMEELKQIMALSESLQWRKKPL